MNITIQHQGYAENITIQYMHEEGYLEFCDHAGAEEKPMEFLAYTSYDNGAYQAPDDSRLEYVMQCDKCPAWLDHYNTWRTD